MTLGERIKQRRLEIDVPVSDIAKACGCSVQSVYDWESGDTKFIRPENLVATARVLKVWVDWLVTGAGVKERAISKDELTKKEDELIRHYRDITKAQQIIVASLAKALHDEGRTGFSEGNR